MTALVIFIVLFGAVLAFWFAAKRDKQVRPALWKVANASAGAVYAEPIKYPPIVQLRLLHDEARRERAELIGDQPDLFDKIEWWLVPTKYCNAQGRFPVPWRGGVIWTTGWTVKAKHRTALSAVGLADPRTVKIEVWNHYSAFPEDDPLP